MGYVIKTEKDIADAFDATDAKLESVKASMVQYDEKLNEAQGSMTETLAIVKETQANLAKLAERQIQGTSEGKQITALIGEQLTWDALHKHPTAIRRKSGINPYEFEPADNDDVLAKFQDASDHLYILAGAMKLVDGNGRLDRAIQATKFYRELFVPLRERAAKAAGDAFSHVAGAGGAEGTEWNPTEFSRRLIEKARLPLQVVALIPSFTMPRSPFLFPTQLADLASYLVSENQDDSMASNTAIPDGKGSTTISGSVTFSSRKLATMAFTSKEIEEDSIVPILPYLEAAVIQAVANGLENAVLNGDRASTHMDADVTAATDVRKAFNGLRDYAINVASSGTKDASGNYIDDDAAWRDYIRGARKLMADPFKGNNGRLAMVVSGNVAIDIGSCEAWRTLFAFGAGSTNKNGDTTGYSPDGLGSFVVSEFQRSTVAATGVNTGGGPNTYTTVLQFAPQAWLMGFQRSMRIEVLRERYAEYDVDAVKITWRGDLQAMLPGNHTVATIGIPAS